MPPNTSPQVRQVDCTLAFRAGLSRNLADSNETISDARGHRPAPRPHAPLVRSAVLRTLRPAACWLRTLGIALFIMADVNARAQLLFADSFTFIVAPGLFAGTWFWLERAFN